MLVLALLLGAFSSAPHTETAAGSAVTWEEALRRARGAPEVVAAGRAAEEKRALDEGVSGLGNPEVGLTAGVRAGEIDTGFDGEVSIVQPIPLAPVGSERREAARAETKALDAQARGILLERSLAVTEAFCGLHAAERVVEEADRGVELASEILAAVERGQRAGIFTSEQVALARAQVAMAQLGRLEAEGVAFDLGIELGRAILHPGPYPLRTQGPLPLVALPARESWATALRAERLPPILARTLEAEAARARLREREVEGRAFWMGIGGTALRESEERALLGTLSFTLPLFERNQRERGQLLAEAREQEGRSAELRAGADALVASLIHEVEHTEETRRLVADELLPAAEERLRLASLAFRAGEATLLEILHAREELVEARIRMHRAEADRALARVRLALFLEAAGGGRDGFE